MTQNKILLSYLGDLYPDWIEGFKLCSVQTTYGWLSHKADARLRELRADGLIERKIEGKYVYYRIKREPVQMTVDNLLAQSLQTTHP